MIADVWLVSEDRMIDFYRRDTGLDQVARELWAAGAYRRQGPSVVTEFAGEDAAEEVFDLTNNPSRDDERALRWGPGRSVSVGDIVSVNGQRFLCMSAGWQAC